MKFIKGFRKYLESIQVDTNYQSIDLMESLSIWQDALLSSISAKKIDLFGEFNLPYEDFHDHLDIEFLADSTFFINSLSSVGLKKSPIQSTEDFETFINKPCKFLTISKIESSELENPIYMLFQTWNETLNKWEDCALYSVGDEMKKFYDKLTSKTLEIIDGDQRYIYSTANGNDWVLQNVEDNNDVYPKSIRREDLQSHIDKSKVKINII